jgi:hypothetical protein
MNALVLQNPGSNGGDAVTDFLPIEGSKRGVAPRCDLCGRFFRVMPLLPPVRIELTAWGTRWGDIAFGPGDQLLVSEKFRRLFAAANLSGIESFAPVEIVAARTRSKGLVDAPRYWLASIVLSRAAVDDLASGLVRDDGPVCGVCRLGGIIKRVRRVVLEENTCSGEDIFYARGLPGTVLVSQRFKSLCEANDLSNCSLVAGNAFHIDYYPQAR